MQILSSLVIGLRGMIMCPGLMCHKKSEKKNPLDQFEPASNTPETSLVD